MPKKPGTSREAILDGTFRLVRDKGHEVLTARGLAAFLGCSTQPIMYQFPNMDMLKDLTYQRADAFHSEYVLAGSDLLEIGLSYIRFAKEEPRLFRFLFQSGRFSGLSLRQLIRATECTGVLLAVIKETKLSPEAAAACFEPLFAAVHGYASLIANNAMQYDPDAVRWALTAVAKGLESAEGSISTEEE